MDCIKTPKSPASLIKAIEATPNPNSYKITLAIPILPDDMWESDSPESDCVLACEIFAAAKIARVFIHENLIVVTKHQDQDWNSIVDGVQIAINSFFEKQIPVFKSEARPDTDSDYLELIREIIRDYIQPAVVSDGGFVRFHSFQNGTVYISMHGACSSCPSSEITLKGYIERILKFRIPEIVAVELVSTT